MCRAKIERHYITDSNPQLNSQVQRPIYPYDNRPMNYSFDGNHQDDEFEKDQEILKGALIGAVGGLAALGVGGLIAYGIRESKVCFIFLKYKQPWEVKIYHLGPSAMDAQSIIIISFNTILLEIYTYKILQNLGAVGAVVPPGFSPVCVVL